MIEDLKFHHTLPIQLRFNDVDKFGHVNNTVYFTYYDLGKTEYFSTVYPSVDWNRDGMVVVHIEADFITQILGTDPVAVQTAVVEIGNKSMTSIQRVINTHTNAAKRSCKSIMVSLSMETHYSIEPPEDWKEAISAFERRAARKQQ